MLAVYFYFRIYMMLPKANSHKQQAASWFSEMK